MAQVVSEPVRPFALFFDGRALARSEAAEWTPRGVDFLGAEIVEVPWQWRGRPKCMQLSWTDPLDPRSERVVDAFFVGVEFDTVGRDAKVVGLEFRSMNPEVTIRVEVDRV